MSTLHFSKLFGTSRINLSFLGLVPALLLSATFVVPSRGQAPDAAKPATATPQPSAEQASTAPLPVIKTESRIVLVDAVVTDKKGNYVHDLKQDDFKVFEDNKEQAVTSFSFGSEPAMQEGGGQKRYMVLFFDNSSMEKPDQIQARAAASKFIEKNASSDRLMAVVEFGGSLQIRQNFTANSELLKSAVSGIQTAYLETNGQSATQSPL